MCIRDSLFTTSFTSSFHHSLPFLLLAPTLFTPHTLLASSHTASLNLIHSPSTSPIPVPLTSLHLSSIPLLNSLLHTVSSNFSTFITSTCLLYTSDAADERSSVDLGGRRIIKKKK